MSTACSTQLSSLRQEGSPSSLYVLDEAKVFQAAYCAMSDVFQDDPVIDMDGPVRGFLVRRTFASDYYQTMIRLFCGYRTRRFGRRDFRLLF